jgi:hypothetical protein
MILRVAFLFCLPAALGAAAAPPIRLNDLEYFEAPGFSFHPFHNDYRGGYQSGLQMIQNGERILDSGDLYLEGAGRAGWRVLRRRVDRAAQTATVDGEIEGADSGYQLIVRSDGARMLVTLKLGRPVDWSRYRQAGFRIALYPGAYFGKSFLADSETGVFPRQYTGNPVLAAKAARIRVAPEDPAVSFLITRSGGTMQLADHRRGSPQPWFSITAPLEPGSPETEVRIEITPSMLPGWRKPPVVGVSQVGYRPQQPKQVVLELDPRDKGAGLVRISKLELDGSKKTAKSGAAKPWGRFLRMQYATFDFSDVRAPGVYLAEYEGHSAGPFRIAEDVYDQAWRPALTYFLPIQMCHVAVKEGSRTWHGACHLDDARQAPVNTRHIDSYVEGERHDTRFGDDEHIDGLDWGGWHDAGDHDLPAGSIAQTALALALAEEEFGPQVDDTAVRRAERLVLLHSPDGKSDLVQQIEFGAESLLGLARPSGHVYAGIIERAGSQYTHLGDPVNVTDNRVCPAPGKGCDDRWVFTARNTGLQYLAAQTLAAAARVLKTPNPALAEESLSVARRLFDYEQTHAPVYAPNSYAPRDSGYRSQELAAAAELLLTTGEAKFRERLVALVPQIRSMTAEQFGTGPGWVLARAADQVNDAAFREAVLEKARQWKQALAPMTAASPYGVPYSKQVGAFEGTRSIMVWGLGWNFQNAALRHYYLHKHLPDLFDAKLIYAVVDMVLGVHPAGNESYVSGVGARSPLIAYGTNRADWSHIPGGVISGASLIRPDFMELKRFPFLWYQTEYVIHGAATYIFDVLAAEKLAGR